MTRAAATTRLFDTGCHSSPGGDSARQRAAHGGIGEDDPVDALHLVTSLLAGHADERARWVGEWFAEGARGNLREYLGIESAGRGHSTAEREIAERDELVCELAQNVTAGRAESEIANYEATGWRLDRLKLENPYPPSSRKALLWRMMKLRPQRLSRRHISRILARKSI
jgi:hypothetical protein